MYAYGPDSDVEHDIDVELLIDPDDECDWEGQPSWLWDAPDPDDIPIDPYGFPDRNDGKSPPY